MADTITGVGQLDPGTRYRLDSARSSARFRATKLGFYPVRGDFGDAVSGELVVHGDSVDALGRASVKGLSTGFGKRDRHLRSPDFLDAAEHPYIELAAEDVPLGEADMTLEVLMTVKGVTRRVPLTVSAAREDGELRVRTSGELDRRTLGIVPPAMWDHQVGGRVLLELDLVATEMDR
jgi:polyisoprenoid-binding protein YceI